MLALAAADSWWVPIVVALISSGALAGAAAGAMKWLQVRRHVKGVKRQGSTFRALVRLNETLEELGVQTGAARCLILRSENGGGIPTPGKTIYSSVIYESDRSTSDRIRDKWQRVPVDAQYAGMLSSVYDKGAVELETSKMKDGDLKDVYVSTGVTRSMVFRIGCSDTAMIYLSICFADGEKITAGHRSQIRSALAYMQEVFRTHGDIYLFDFGS